MLVFLPSISNTIYNKSFGINLSKPNNFNLIISQNYEKL